MFVQLSVGSLQNSNLIWSLFCLNVHCQPCVPRLGYKTLSEDSQEFVGGPIAP